MANTDIDIRTYHAQIYYLFGSVECYKRLDLVIIPREQYSTIAMRTTAHFIVKQWVCVWNIRAAE